MKSDFKCPNCGIITGFMLYCGEREWHTCNECGANTNQSDILAVSRSGQNSPYREIDRLLREACELEKIINDLRRTCEFSHALLDSESKNAECIKARLQRAMDKEIEFRKNRITEHQKEEGSCREA